MLRSMYAGISGMRANQTKLDVTGNNISNSGTIAFKGSRVRFEDMLSQNVSEAVGPGRNQGGINPRQVGLGVQVAGIDTNMEQGVMQPTNRNLDAAIDGEGYFIVARGALPTNNNLGIGIDRNNHTITSSNGFSISYTRDGSFTLDPKGNLLNSNGYRIMGYALKEKGNASSPVSIDYNANGVCNFVDCDSKDGLEADSVLVPLRIPSSIYVNASDVKQGSDDKTKTYMNYVGTAEKTGVKNPSIYTNGKFQGKQDLEVGVAYEGDETIVLINGQKLVDENGDTIKNVTTIDKSLLVEFYKDTHGYKAGEADAKAIEEAAGKYASNLLGGSATDTNDGSTVNLESPTVPANADKSKYGWAYTLTSEGDRKVTSFSIEDDGQLKATLEDGKVAALGQIAMASFNNTSGLKKLGKNLYQNTANSGAPIVRSSVGVDPSVDNGDGYGHIRQSVLEMANVDLAEQFTDMIVASRSFQANGKMITTGDEILQDIINLKR